MAVNHPASSRCNDRIRRKVSLAADQCVENVPAVELPDREKIQSGYEDPNPAGEQQRIQHDLLVSGEWSEMEFVHPLQNHRVTEDQSDIFRIDEYGLCRVDAEFGKSGDSEPGTRQSQDESRQRSADRNIKHGFPVGVTGALKDHSPHCADR